MSSARIPWWLWPVAASFIACFVVGFLYLPFKIPRAHGITLEFSGKNRVKKLSGEAVSPAWDIWAMAVVTYEMLTGKHPFPGMSLSQMHHSIVQGRFTPVAVDLPGAPAQWQQFFERALSLNPAERPRSAREFLSTLTMAFGLAGKTASE